MNLFDALKQYIRDAAPGGLLNPEGEPVAQYGRKVKGNVRGLLDDPAAFTQSALLDVLPSGMELDSVRARAEGRDYDKFAYQKAMDKAVDLGSLVGSIRVFHGSPHKFNKFDLSKIGSGEGAQAYGHGAYVAESPDVARTYLGQGSTRGGSKTESMLVKKMEQAQSAGRYGEALALEDLLVNRSPTKALSRFSDQSGGKQYQEATEAVKRYAKYFDEGGNLYEADLRWPDAAREAADPMGPQHFLDWDKPLSEQNSSVKNAVQSLMEKRAAESEATRLAMNAQYPNRTTHPVLSKIANKQRTALDFKGEAAISELVRELGGPDKAAKFLREQGIPGIRYLDAGSRGAGQGTANYVVFDDALIEILKRNGVPVRK